MEAAGQPIRIFRYGLDYAFILAGCGAYYPSVKTNPSARSTMKIQRVYKSLQGRPGVSLLPTPRRCHTLLGLGFADVSPVFTLPLRIEATLG